ncbi:hypothetical protein CEUSTIGMA_g10231.t1 [Chlamydomonas eustigma]|uniref:Uncharacterized protein n=1 Tax=Chlamydomonas eustigma TaxID=1157962 RepID=A0A250XI87_9CHLO|nr:hypothetical protein CEUSTIGMA_g10231.t1 [Chlamydomonas eustigma]|eukprot:GAX82805.1 hypothetical protein CEUSTIGMA_g10231.t1 [Chlamydomonas eustigma]
MAETDIEPPTAEAVADATATQSDFGPGHDAHGELPPYDESLLIRVKGRVKKPVKPDDTERNITIDKLNAEIKKHHDRMAEIKALEQSRRTRTANPEVVEHRRAKERLQGEWKAVLQQKMMIREDFQRAQTEKEVLRNELREIRNKIPRGTKLETIETDIQQLEFKLEHESLSGPEEKKAQQQLANLVAARPLSRQVAMLEEKLKIVEDRRASAKEKLDQCDAVLSTIKEQEQTEQIALDEYQRQREEANVDFPALQVEKQECWEVIQALKTKVVEVRDEFNKQYQEWQLQNKHYSIWLRHEKKAQYEERQKQREMREADRQADEEAAVGPTISEPFEAEIFTVDQLLTYLRKFLTTEEVAVKLEEKQIEVPQGLKAFKKKNEEDLSFFTSVQKGGKGSKGSKARAASQTVKASAAPPTESKRKLQHSLETLKTFMTLGIDVPQNTTEIATTIEKVEAKKEEYLEKRKRAKEAPSSSAKTQVLPANGNHVPDEEEEEEDKVEVDGDAEVDETEAGQENGVEDAAASEPAGASTKDVEISLSVDQLSTAVALKLVVCS